MTWALVKRLQAIVAITQLHNKDKKAHVAHRLPDFSSL